MRLSTFALTLALAATPPAAGSQDASAAERAVVVQLVTDAYVDGVHNFSDPVAIRRGFHPDFEMLVLRDGKLEKLALEKWIERITASSQKAPPDPAAPAVSSVSTLRTTTAKFPVVDVAGSAASCKVEIWREGRQVFTDYLSLYRFEDGWKIVGKTFYRHP